MAGTVVFAAFVVSCLVWGPLGIVAYVGGLFNSPSILGLTVPLFLLILVAAGGLLILCLDAVLPWRKGSRRFRLPSVTILCGALVAPFGLTLVGVVPSPFEMFVRGFARYAGKRVDVTAIQNWRSTLDPKQYMDEQGGVVERPLAPSEQPPDIARLHPKTARFASDENGRMIVQLLWGGGFIGHWGIEFGDEGWRTPPDSQTHGYRPLAPGVRVWYED